MHYYQVSVKDNGPSCSLSTTVWHICYCEPSALLYVNAVATKGHFPICCHEITLPTTGNDQPWKWISTQFIFMKDNSKGNKHLCSRQRVFIGRFIFIIFFNMLTICTPPVLVIMDCLQYKKVNTFFAMLITLRNMYIKLYFPICQHFTYMGVFNRPACLFKAAQ